MGWRATGLWAGLLLITASAGLLAGAQAQVEQVHLGLDDATPSDSLVVSWSEQAPRAMAPTVTVTGPDGQEATFTALRVDGPALGAVYEAVLTDLEPGTSYAYQIDGDEPRSFTTPPAELSDGASFRVVGLGDMGITEQSQATARTVAGLGPDLVLHMGDLSYAEGDQTQWATWFEMIEPTAQRAPWLPAIGNHETLPPVTEVAYYEQRFALANNERWYSFDWAGVHIVALDTYSQSGYPYTGDQLWRYDEQRSWLEQDLAEHSQAPWTIVFLHEAPYSSNSHGPSQRVQAAFDDLFEEHGVDLVLAGHDHGYERTFPLIGGAPTSHHADTYQEGEGVIHVVSGAAGQSLYTGWTDDPPDWSAARESLYHVVELTVSDQAIQGRVVPTAESTFQDSFTLQKAPVATLPAGERGDAGTEETPWPGAAALAIAVAGLALATSRRGLSPR